jgi:hypothetical protein
VIAMVCTTVKTGVECFFMSKNGCQFTGGSCHTVIEACNGCQKAKEFSAGKFCLIFPEPATKWRTGKCNMATHVEKAAPKEVVKVNPLKASKRSAK